MFVHDNTSFLVLIHGPVAQVHLALTANVVFAAKHFAGGLEGVLEGLEIPVELVALAGGGHICSESSWQMISIEGYIQPNYNFKFTYALLLF